MAWTDSAARGLRLEDWVGGTNPPILAPLPGRSSALERLIASGRVSPARLDLRALGPPSERPHEITISEALAEQRREG